MDKVVLFQILLDGAEPRDAGNGDVLVVFSSLPEGRLTGVLASARCAQCAQTE